MIDDPLAWLFALDQFGIKFGLDNIRTLVAALNHPEQRFRSIHVAGTNGKGSVTAMVATALSAAGHRTARYTSPHLVDLSERFVVDGVPVSQTVMRAAVQDVREVIGRLRTDGALLVQPTFFEVTTAVAFELFSRAGANVAVCEVGLGGRLDATNVLQPVATAITSIALDHQQYLGTTLREIAREKAGIIKPGVPVVVGPMASEALDEIVEVAGRQGAPVHAVRAEDIRPQADEVRPNIREPMLQTVHLQTPLHDYGRVKMSLAGTHQIANAHVAVRLLELADASGISVPASSIVHALGHTSWPGRLDFRRLADGREMLLDAAHNPDGAAALAAFLRDTHWPALPVVFGAMRDKDIAGMLATIAPAASVVILTKAATARSADPTDIAIDLQRLRPALPVVVEPDLAKALALAWRSSPRIVVGGSIFLLGDVLKMLNEA